MLEFNSNQKDGLPLPFFPMNPTPKKEAFNDPGFIFEPKWDGMRAVAMIDEGLKLYSRNRNRLDTRHPRLREVLAPQLLSLSHRLVLDGELVVINDMGKISRRGMLAGDFTPSSLLYILFDIVWLDGEDLTSYPLILRKEKLAEIVGDNFTNVMLTEYTQEDGVSLFEAIKAQPLEATRVEGMIAKKKDSHYQIPATRYARTKNWLKVRDPNYVAQ